jgi:hypothetical protein
MCEYIVGIQNQQPVYADGLPPAEPFVLPAHVSEGVPGCERAVSAEPDTIEAAIATIAVAGVQLAEQFGTNLRV